jgi:AmiR/NasT family two-component response regulator
MYGLRIVIADPDPLFRKHIKEKLLKGGHMVVGESSDGRNALQMIFNIQPDLVIMNAQMTGRDGLEVAKIIEEHRVAPVLLITEHDRQDELKEALDDWMISYIVRPIDAINLFPAIEVCVATFKKLCRLEQENKRLKQTIETRKIIEKAKGLLIESKGMTEQQAFKHIQKVSMDKCLPIQNVAKLIIQALEKKKIQRGIDVL